MNIDGFDVKNELPESLTLEDQWIVSALNTVTKEVTENLENMSWASRCRSFTTSFGTNSATGTLNWPKPG